MRRVFNIPVGKGQDDEWLACGHIFQYEVDCVMPYDGSGICKPELSNVIAPNEWKFDWQKWLWVDIDETVIIVGEESEDDADDNRDADTTEDLASRLEGLKLITSE